MGRDIPESYGIQCLALRWFDRDEYQRGYSRVNARGEIFMTLTDRWRCEGYDVSETWKGILQSSREDYDAEAIIGQCLECSGTRSRCLDLGASRDWMGEESQAFGIVSLGCHIRGWWEGKGREECVVRN